MTTSPGAVLLGTVALEPNRWATVDPSGRPLLALADWLPAIEAAGFDGIELWERHLTDAPARDVRATVFNTYASFDDADPARRQAAARWARATGSTGVKVNVGADVDALADYAARLGALAADLPDDAAVLCECHAGTCVADDPDRAAALLAAAGPADRIQAIVHTHQSADALRARFEAYGDRITHVHVNFLDPATAAAPPLAEVRGRLAAAASLLTSLGFAGSWTIEFVHGLLTSRDRPDDTLAQAIADLAVLRDVLGEVAA